MMSNFPKVYGFCDAGCRRRVPSYDEFATVAPLAEKGMINDEYYALRAGKAFGEETYRVYKLPAWILEVQLEGDTLTHLITFDRSNLWEEDAYTDYYKLKINAIETSGTVCTMRYEVNGERKSVDVTCPFSVEGASYSLKFYPPTWLSNGVATRPILYLYNDDLIFKAESGDSVIIRYSAYADGTDFTEEWSEGQYYIGFAVAGEAPTGKSQYTWCKFVSDNLGDTEAALDAILEIQNTLIGGITE